MSAKDIEKATPDYLADEIRQRVARAPIKFNFRVQISEKRDKIEDPSMAWPDTRKLVDVGLIEITRVVSDSDATERTLLFCPAKLPKGIEPADPMIEFRNAAYIISYARRHQQNTEKEEVNKR